MRLHRFFIPETIGKQAQVSIHSAELVNQVRRVFRLKKGDSVVLFDGSGSDYQCQIVESTDRTITFNVESVARSRFVPARKIYLCAAVVKKDNFEWIVEKATELGVTDIIPVMAERSEKKSLNEARLKKIATEASEQSGRGDVPVVHAVVTLRESIENLKKIGEEDSDKSFDLIAFHTEGDLFEHGDLSKDAPVALFIGPEGGWSPDEIDLFHKNDVRGVSLGSQVLRAETAVIAALSMVVFGK